MCIDRAVHICRLVGYYIKPYMIVLCVLLCPAVPFFTLTLPYILAAVSLMRDTGDASEVFLCSFARVYEDGHFIKSIKIFLGREKLYLVNL